MVRQNACRGATARFPHAHGAILARLPAQYIGLRIRGVGPIAPAISHLDKDFGIARGWLGNLAKLQPVKLLTGRINNNGPHDLLLILSDSAHPIDRLAALPTSDFVNKLAAARIAPTCTSIETNGG